MQYFKELDITIKVHRLAGFLIQSLSKPKVAVLNSFVRDGFQKTKMMGRLNANSFWTEKNQFSFIILLYIRETSAGPEPMQKYGLKCLMKNVKALGKFNFVEALLNETKLTTFRSS